MIIIQAGGAVLHIKQNLNDNQKEQHGRTTSDGQDELN